VLSHLEDVVARKGYAVAVVAEGALERRIKSGSVEFIFWQELLSQKIYIVI
jgi:hypothetical protein